MSKHNIPMNVHLDCVMCMCQCNKWRSTYGAHSIILLAMCIVRWFVHFIYLYFHYRLCSLSTTHTYTRGHTRVDTHTHCLGEPGQFIRIVTMAIYNGSTYNSMTKE